MGQVSVDAAIADTDFRSWLAERSLARLPDASEARAVALDELFDELEVRLGRYTSRTPRLKIYRVLASFFPSDFTTVSHLSKLRQLHTVMFGNRGGKGPTCHANILRRLLETIGPVGDDSDAVVDRMRLPWLLFTHYVAPSGEERTEYPKGVPGEERLVPLPAARRRKGLTGVTDGRQALLNILEFCRDGATREDLKSHIKTVSPRLKDNSITTQINVIASELNCLKPDGDRFVLTLRQCSLWSRSRDRGRQTRSRTGPVWRFGQARGCARQWPAPTDRHCVLEHRHIRCAHLGGPGQQVYGVRSGDEEKTWA